MNRWGIARRTAALVALAVTGGAAAATACASFSEEPPAGIGADAGDAALGEGGEGIDSGTCPSGAFCDSFDDDNPLPRAWKSLQQGGGATLEVVKDAGPDGSGALVVSLTNSMLDQKAYLNVERGANGPAAYTVVLSFSARVSVAGTGFVLTARFNTDQGTGADAGERDVIVDFHGGFTRLDKFTPSCDGGCAVPNKDVPIDDAWHRYVLTLNARPPNGLNHGDILYEVDGNPVVSGTLAFSLSNPKSYGFQVGVTYSAGKTPGTVAFDDVVLVVKP
ncbi:MAG: hypothetical protein JWO86_8689 [Myxococcaceae bacterium]|nr:hypothetical protein [Myxococcaceae bacterium]